MGWRHEKYFDEDVTDEQSVREISGDNASTVARARTKFKY
jgi:hypothetical protein